MAITDFESWFQFHNKDIPLSSVPPVLLLAAEGATVPFIARYRKEQTGNLDEVGVRKVLAAKEEWDEILNRQRFIRGEIEKQGKLTPELQKRISATFDRDLLEDLYLPFKQKRKTKAQVAREAGLGEIADKIWALSRKDSLESAPSSSVWAQSLVNPEKGLADVGAVIKGVVDILTEKLSDDPDLRAALREFVFSKGFLTSEKGEKAKDPSKYEGYFKFQESLVSLQTPKAAHRYMALRRGWKEEELKLKITGPVSAPADQWESELLLRVMNVAIPKKDGQEPEILQLLTDAAKLALKAFLLPSIENEVHRNLKTSADEACVQVFGENLENLLLAAPLGPKTVLGVDPGIASGSKLAVVDKTGALKAHEIIHTQSVVEKKTATLTVLRLIKENAVEAVAVGNGTHGRETEAFVRSLLKEAQVNIPVVRVSESGASVYSASEIAREEFPDLDLTIRGAVSIARRLQDPLAELVKVDPKSIGVGQYQHDVSQNFLKKSLEQIVDSCVNRVGVNINTASPYLLARVSGIGDSLARAIVEHRAQNGLFKSRHQLTEIPRFSQKTFELAAGFVRIPESDNPLDNTGVHPERYETLKKWAEELNIPVSALTGSGVSFLKGKDKFKEEVGPFTFEDICSELEKPGRDPREEFVPLEFRDDIHSLKDLKEGMECPGIVTNVTNFGAFVDIGVHQDGLVHLSQLSDRFIKDPREVVKPGDRVKVRVIEVDLKKNQIGLSMKSPETGDSRKSHASSETRKPFGGSEHRNSRADGPRRSSAPGSREPTRMPPHSQNNKEGGRPGNPRGFKPEAGGQWNDRRGAAAPHSRPAGPAKGLPSRSGLVYNPFADALSSLSLPKSQGAKSETGGKTKK